MSGAAGTELSRRRLLLGGALATASACGAAAAGPFAARSQAQAVATRDLDIIGFALGLELLEATFYRDGVRRVRGLRGETREVAKTIRDSELEHVEILTDLLQQLGGTPPGPPRFDFGDAFSGEASFLGLAQTLEDSGVGAYNGVAPLISSGDVLAVAGAIVQVEARHAGVIRLLRGADIAPAALDRALSMDEAARALERYIRR